MVSVCPAPTCRKTFGHDKALNAHLARSENCVDWISVQISHEELGLTLNDEVPYADRPYANEADDREFMHDKETYEDGAERQLLQNIEDHDGFHSNDNEHNMVYSQEHMDVSDSFENPIDMDSLRAPDLPVTAKRYFICKYPDTGRTFGRGITPYQSAMDAEADSDNIAYPFAGLEEWGLARWFETSGISQAKIDDFLKLPWVSVITFY